MAFTTVEIRETRKPYSRWWVEARSACMVEPLRGGERNKGATFYAREVNRRGESTRLCGIRTRLCARSRRWRERGRERDRKKERERERAHLVVHSRRVYRLASARHLRALTDIQRSGAQRCSTRRVFKTGCWNAANGWTDGDTREGTCVTENPSRWRSRCHVALSEAAQSVPLYYPSRSHENSGPRVWWGVTVPWIFLSAIQFSLRGSFLLDGRRIFLRAIGLGIGSVRAIEIYFIFFSIDITMPRMIREGGFMGGEGRKKIEWKEDVVSFVNFFCKFVFHFLFFVDSFSWCRWIFFINRIYTYNLHGNISLGLRNTFILPLPLFFHAQQIFAHILHIISFARIPIIE